MEIIKFDALLQSDNLPGKEEKYVLVTGLPENYSNAPEWIPLPEEYAKFREKLPKNKKVELVIRVRKRKTTFIDPIQGKITKIQLPYCKAVETLMAEIRIWDLKSKKNQCRAYRNSVSSLRIQINITYDIQRTYKSPLAPHSLFKTDLQIKA